MNAVRPPSPSAPPSPPTAAAPAAPRGGPDLSAAELADLRPHVITLEDGKLATGAPSEPRDVGAYRTTTGDIDALFETHLPAFVAAHAPGPVPVVLYAHGGLVDKASGFGIAQQQVVWWKENGVYPIHFVWETGLGTALWDALRRWASGGRRGWVDEQLAQSRSLYKRKCERMLAALERHMREDVHWTVPNGGFFTWLTLPAGGDAGELAKRAVEHGVAVVPGSLFFSDERGGGNVRLSFSLVDEGEIDEGIERLASLVKP